MLDALKQLVSDLELEPDFTRIASMVVTRVTMILDCEICSLYVLNRQTNELWLIANEGFDSQAVRELRLPFGKGVVGLVAERTEPLNLLDLTRHPQFIQVDGLDDQRYCYFLGAPIIHHGEVQGVLVAQRSEEAFTEDDVGLFASLATSLSNFVNRALVTGEVTRTARVASKESDRQFTGSAGSPGIAIGQAYVIQRSVTLDEIPERDVEDTDIELTNFESALTSVREELQRINDRMADQLDQEELDVFDAYLHMLDDDAIPNEVRDEIREGVWAQRAVATVFLEHTAKLAQAESSYLAERSQDVRDLGERLLANMQEEKQRETYVPDDLVLVSDEVSASMLGEMPRDKLVAVVSRSGSRNSHTAILARALNIPAVMGATEFPLIEVEDATLVVDGSYGNVVVNPSDAATDYYNSLIHEEKEFEEILDGIKDQPSMTPDGHRINLWVNIGLVTEITRSLDMGAEGIGLFRTEIPFASRDRFPTEEEQRRIYREHMEAFDPRPVTMRTLDIGGDKDLPYFAIKEENPFLGWRGVRVTLDHPDILLLQVRAMIKANAGLEGTLRIMLPMVSNLREIRTAKDLILQAFREVRDEGIDVKRPDVGVMIEVPAVIYQARQIAKEVDFLAVGSNDLTQYMLAVSRNNPRVADLYQEFHPAVLRALRELAKAAHSEGKGIGICGEMAGTVEGAVLCIGMGYDVLSMNATNLLKIKWVIRNISRTGCRRILARVLRMDDANEILHYIRDQLVGIGLERALPHHESAPIFY